MLWVTDASGALTFLTSEWETLTGQPIAAAHGFGWLDRVHADDRPIILDGLRAIAVSQVKFVMRFRVLQKIGDPVWVISSASPATLPETGEFLGHFGAINRPQCEIRLQGATVNMGSSRTPSLVPDRKLPSAVEGLADQIIYARDLAAQANEKGILNVLDIALITIGYRLAEEQAKEPVAKPGPLKLV